MKIDILREPPNDIFRDYGKFKLYFLLLLALACFGLLLGVYAIVSDTKYYENLEIAALAFFVAAAVLLFYVGEKLQAYKKLTPPEQKELADLGQKYFEIKGYCDLVAKAGRRIILAEFEACQVWAEERRRQDEQDIKF